MRIGKYLNTTKEAVEGKEFNIFYGLSLGNKYFTSDHVREYIRWAMENTKDKVLILIPDKIQAVNYEVKNEYSLTRALAVALRKGAEIESMVKEIIEDLQIPASKIRVVHWQDIEDEEYGRMYGVISDAFEHHMRFRQTVVAMVKETPHLKGLNLVDAQYEKLALYIINELPVLINGITLSGTYYGLFPYPGFASLDYLAIDLQEGTTFPDITSQLRIENKLKLIELYVDSHQ